MDLRTPMKPRLNWTRQALLAPHRVPAANKRSYDVSWTTCCSKFELQALAVCGRRRQTMHHAQIPSAFGCKCFCQAEKSEKVNFRRSPWVTQGHV